MSNYSFTCFKGSNLPAGSATKSSDLLFAQSKKNSSDDDKTANRQTRFSAGASVFVTLLFLSLFTQLKAQQVTNTTTFPLNDYLTTEKGSPYPVLVQSKLDAIDTSKFLNVMNYGAKGDGKTWDDDAIEAAFKDAKYGVIFPSGKTFLVHKLTKVHIPNRDMTVYAYGAAFKMDKFSKYSFLSLEYEQNSYHNTVIWLGGKFYGNKKNQSWPGSPTGNNTWEEDHGRLLGICYAEFALVKDVTIAGPVMDGIGLEACKIAVIADSKASGGAPFKYNEVQEQGTYFKVTRVGLKAAYFLNLTCDGGSIGTHVSYPTKSPMDEETLSVHVNCHYDNQVQNAIHIEDCYKNFFYNCTIGADTGYQYNPSVHLSNRSGIVSIKNCRFTNARVNFNNASDLKLGIIDGCQFVSEFKSFTSPLNTFIEGRPTVCINSSFSGRTTAKNQGELKNVRNCMFTNFDSLAIQGGYAVDSCTFITGSKPANLSKGGFVVSSSFTDVQDTLFKNGPVDNEWKKTYLSYIDIVSDKNVYLGRITCGGNSDESKKSKIAFNSASVSMKITTTTNVTTNNEISKSQQKTSIYPNPAVDVLHVTLNEKVGGKTLLIIYDQQGRILQTKTVYKNTPVSVETMSVNNLASGSYVLQIVNELQTSSLRFIVAK